MSFAGALNMIRHQSRDDALASIAFLRRIRAECGPDLSDDERAELLALERDIKGVKR